MYTIYTGHHRISYYYIFTLKIWYKINSFNTFTYTHHNHQTMFQNDEHTTWILHTIPLKKYSFFHFIHRTLVSFGWLHGRHSLYFLFLHFQISERCDRVHLHIQKTSIGFVAEFGWYFYCDSFSISFDPQIRFTHVIYRSHESILYHMIKIKKIPNRC